VVLAGPDTEQLYDTRFQLRQDGQRQQVAAWLARAGVEQPKAEVAHLEAVLLDLAAYLVEPVSWSGPDGESEDYERGWAAACDAVQARLRVQLERVLANRRHLARHEAASSAARPSPHRSAGSGESPAGPHEPLGA